MCSPADRREQVARLEVNNHFQRLEQPELAQVAERALQRREIHIEKFLNRAYPDSLSLIERQTEL